MAGRPEAQYYLGAAYSRGLGSTAGKDPSSNSVEAKKWYDLAAKTAQQLAPGGDPAAQMTLASLKWYGLGGVATDQPGALKLAPDAAAQNYVPAEWWVASTNQLGQIKSADDALQDLDLSVRAASAGHSGGMANLGFYFLDKRQKARAKPWFERAAMMGNDLATRRLLWDWNIRVGPTGLPGDNRPAGTAVRQSPVSQQPVVAAAPRSLGPPSVQMEGRDAAGFLMFDAGGYSTAQNTTLLDEFYLGSTEHLAVGRIMIYFQEFVQQLRRIPGCGQAVSDTTFQGLTAAAGRDFLGQTIKGFEDLQRLQNHNLATNFQSGADVAMEQVMVVPDADADARILFGRHGCSSPVAQQLFRNLTAWVADPG